MRRSFAPLSFITCALVALGCEGANDPGDLTVLVEPEPTILNGVAAGDAADEIGDGWSVDFDRYVVVIGDLELRFATDQERVERAEDLFVVDLTEVRADGLALWTLSELPAGAWDLYYRIAGADDDALRDDSVRQRDFEEMREEDWTYLIEGRIDNPDGRSCPPTAVADPGDASPQGEPNDGGDPCYANQQVSFRLGVSAETRFGPCSVDDRAGVTIPSGGTQAATLSLHGDHVLFAGFPTADESSISRRGQWLADTDLNLDGEVTREELEQIDVADLPAMDGYQLNGPIEIDTAWDYVVAQLKTQGHFQGEGECDVDGVAHEHDHGDDHDDHDHD